MNERARLPLRASLVFFMMTLVAFACGRSTLEDLDAVDGGAQDGSVPVDGAFDGPADGPRDVATDAPRDAGRDADSGRCGPITCAGCCAAGLCQPGDEDGLCGVGGQECASCAVQNGGRCEPNLRQCVGVVDAGCNGQTCPNGCCETFGGQSVCVSPGTGPNTCGTGGVQCRRCADQGQVCNTQTRTCDAQTCNAQTCPNGCCQGNQCVAGTTQGACGVFGQACGQCAANERCDAVPGLGGQCVQVTTPCDGQSCPNGCCRNGVCEQGTSDQLCGTGGTTCAACGNGFSCVAQGVGGGGRCEVIRVCDGATCPNGCCTAQRSCVTPGDTSSACGGGGETCEVCGNGTSCQADDAGTGRSCRTVVPTCNPQSCPNGCCNSQGVCVSPATTAAACGRGGEACEVCTGTNTCQSDSNGGLSCLPPVVNCNSVTCPGGCCRNNQCQPGTTNQACGNLGESCETCGVSSSCQNDAVGAGRSCRPLVPQCNATTCPNGCCRNNTCVTPGTTNASCGTGGQACAVCSSNQQCSAGPGNTRVCRTVCNATVCPSGCCQGDQCVTPGNSALACGSGGGACQTCTGTNVCLQQGNTRSCQPPCNAVTCPSGCCQGDVCQLGFTDARCGKNAQTCQDCTSQGASCGPQRTCVPTSTTCPAPYPSCPAGVRMASTPRQDVCPSDYLEDARQACAGGAHTAQCQSFFQVLAGSSPNCAACLAPFDYDFQEGRGIFVCLSPFVQNLGNCARNFGCFVDCQEDSCDQCSAASEQQCHDDVRQGTSAQCRSYYNNSFGAVCVLPLLGNGSVCNPLSYGDFGAWLEAVGRRYCDQ